LKSLSKKICYKLLINQCVKLKNKIQKQKNINYFTNIFRLENLTLYGNIITVFVIALFLWITIDLNNYLKTANPGTWTWIAKITTSQNNLATILTINLMQALTIFLTLVIIFEILTVIYVYPRKNNFSQKITQKLFANL